MNKFIWEKKNALSSEFCKNTIYKFERDLRKARGVTLGGPMDDVKVSDDIPISHMNGWLKEDHEFYNNLGKYIPEYKQYCEENLYARWNYDLNDSGYQIQRTIGGKGFYDWHHDYCYDEHGNRKITFIWYLNDVPEPGGYTEFIDGSRVQPEEGKLIFFPATWDFVHRGVMPKEGVVKYICTGWLHSQENT